MGKRFSLSCCSQHMETFDQKNSSCPRLDSIFGHVESTVIPRLLDVFEAEVRPVVPYFIHGDLWEGNFGMDISTRKLWVFNRNG